ncbi:hypothetical protein OLX02_10405 [Novosphingobium sp. KCTC 2891]|uniref:hypothetical protein n=1 Tax=Novosphingobium sp. KCTC 2891 TaxID=2989730 RepID=UPI00222287E9|nr:hypothetical protein [Novosphingobium sp. KCTC 2891]MCW1383233.1 hypothetical protein [Novosphingobium sp. KCTC 2891]
MLTITEALAALAAKPGFAMAVQAVLSLGAILAVYAITRAMGLGGDVPIRDEAHARALAEEAFCGFDAADVALDRARIGALLRGADGRVLLLRRHGSHFAARLLTSHAGIRLDRQFLTVAPGEKRFGAVTLDLGPAAQAWAASLRRIGTRP